MPNIRIKRAVKYNTFDDDALLGSHNVGDNKVFKVTRLGIQSLGGPADCYVTDRSGTIDNFLVSGTLNPSQTTLLGKENNPIYEVVGTFAIRGRGSVAAGTFNVSFEGVES